MSKTFDQGKEEVARLCQYFATNRQAFLAPGVKEAHVRQSLIDPLFESLGWDVRNAAMTAPQFRSAAFAFFGPNCFTRAARMASRSMPSRCARTPS